MSNRELLELSAKAAGMAELRWCEVWNCMARPTPGGRFALTSCWDPLEDDGQAFRLAVVLGLSVDVGSADRGITVVNRPIGPSRPDWVESSARHLDDPLSATRRAIVMAAAEIARK